jgi:pyruvate dehydrogenase E1 component beta subunit
VLRVSEITYRQACKQAIVEEMRRDPRVFVMGQDVRTGLYADALQEIGDERIRNTPICEAGFYGAGIGAALTGMRPVIEAAFATFFYSAMDQIANQAAKSRYMFGGQASVPLVIRGLVAYSVALAAHHSDAVGSVCAGAGAEDCRSGHSVRCERVNEIGDPRRQSRVVVRRPQPVRRARRGAR